MSRFQAAFDACKARDWGAVDTEWKKVTDQYPGLFAGHNVGLSVGPGWWVALDACFKEIDGLVAKVPGAVFKAVQIKEKFGGLRFYFNITREGVDADGGDDDGILEVDGDISELRRQCYEAIERAEIAVSKACEECGEPGSRRHDLDWIATLCDTHYRMVKESGSR